MGTEDLSVCSHVYMYRIYIYICFYIFRWDVAQYFQTIPDMEVLHNCEGSLKAEPPLELYVDTLAPHGFY